MRDLEQFGLNDRQRAFVHAVLDGRSVTAAAEQVGYTPDSGYSNIQKPHVLAAIHHGVQRRLQSEAPISLRVLCEIRDDTKAPARVRADVGVKLLQLAGHVAPRTETSAADKPLSEMSRDEMVAFIERNQAAIDRAADELANRAKDVSVPNSVPKSTKPTPKPLNYLD